MILPPVPAGIPVPPAGRYLTSFDSRRSLHQFCDVLVVGSGIAGMRAALEIPDHLHAIIVTKETLEESNSSYAQGGIAGVMGPEDSFENHIQDTLIAGAGLCDPEIVDLVIREAPAQIADLIRFGTSFDQENGSIALTREGGHSHRRIVHALGDATGFEVMRAMIRAGREAPNITFMEDTFTLDLLIWEGRCVGIVAVHPVIGKVLIRARQVILASGGCGMVYRETTNPNGATGDGMAAAWRAGAKLRDMEFMQFHPTVLYVAGSARSLISEAVRGEGGYLRDVNGERFMLADDPRAELAPRDIVSQAIVRCMERTQHSNVYLDLRHMDPVRVRERFPGINRACRSFGLHITKDLIPVRPGAHYMVGGIQVDAVGRTSIPGLWAIGEVSSSGLHGANRLASNSLIEGLVFGTLAVRHGLEEMASMPADMRVLPVAHAIETDDPVDTLDVGDLTNSLRSLMVRKMGIVRTQSRMKEARQDIEFWCRYVLSREFGDKKSWGLQNLLTVARLMVISAMEREESRGTHFRSDFPKRDEEHWNRHVVV